MSELKCPFCQQELLLSSYRDGDKDNEIWNCLHCQIGGKRKLWQELIRTRKALDVAVGALKWIAYDENDEQDGLEEFAISQMVEKADEAIKQITALEQKD